MEESTPKPTAATNLSLPYNYVVSLVELTWNDLIFAIKQGYMTPEAAIEHAMDVIDKEQIPSQNLIDLVWLPKDVDIYPYLDEFSSPMSEEDCNIVQAKMLYVLLKWVFENKEHFADPLEVAEVIYADFGYPPEISLFVRYMPADGPVLDSVELNRQHLYNHWYEYIESQKLRFAVTD